jgi:hypothetical protein
MKVTFGDSFFDSLKRIKRYNTWWYKTYDFFVINLPEFIKNVYRFRKELYDHRWWDYRFTLNMLQRSLEIMEEGLREKGLEISETRDPKLKSIRRAIELLKNNREDIYIEKAEKELGEIIMKDNWFFDDDEEGNTVLAHQETEEEIEHNRKVFKRADEISNQEWEELWQIFKGTENSKSFNEKYDGTDMRCWWD